MAPLSGARASEDNRSLQVGDSRGYNPWGWDFQPKALGLSLGALFRFMTSTQYDNRTSC